MQELHNCVVLTEVEEWKAGTVACKVAKGAAAGVGHTHGWALTENELEDMVPVKMAREAEKSKGFSFWIIFHRH